MNPLQTIKNWLNSFEPEQKIEIAFLTCYYHPDRMISEDSGPEQVEAFMNYLDSANLPAKEVCSRAVVTMGLIDFGLYGRKTEEDWNEVRATQERVREYITDSEEAVQIINTQIETFDRNKEFWMRVSLDWDELKRTALSHTAIDNWRFMNIRPILNDMRVE